MEKIVKQQDKPIYKYDVFISYSTIDTSIANELRKSIENEGLSCFMSEKDIPTASPWVDEIRNAIHLSKRVLLLITPRSIDRPWILLETGAAWALQKELIPALMFVSPSDLVEPIRRYQAQIIETTDQKNYLVREIASFGSIDQIKIDGCWIDRSDEDTVFFQQNGNQVVGIYNYGRNNKVGYYIGTLKGRTFEYEWIWYDKKFQGNGRMLVSENNKLLDGQWWNKGEEISSEHVAYEYIGNMMPIWVTEDDFNRLWKINKEKSDIKSN